MVTAVRVHASSVNPPDNGIAAGMLKRMGVDYDYPVIIGRDYAGVVEQVGADVTGYAEGDSALTCSSTTLSARS